MSTGRPPFKLLATATLGALFFWEPALGIRTVPLLLLHATVGAVLTAHLPRSSYRYRRIGLLLTWLLLIAD